MRVLQLIDSLDGGGAERIAVNVANSLTAYVDKSFLCATRKEGILKDTIVKDVTYLFLQRKSRFDFSSLRKLSRFIRTNNITHIHAHGTSFFTAVLVRMLYVNIKIIWHDHNGDRENTSCISKLLLIFFSKYFNAIIVVNHKLKAWSETYLKCNTVYFLNNFVDETANDKLTIEPKQIDGFKLVCLANVRAPKDHINLLKAYTIAKKNIPNLSLHLVGKVDVKSNLYKNLLDYINKKKITEIYFYGSQMITTSFLKKFDIGVLSSLYEGLPVALLEYGVAKLPTITTDVGQCSEVVGNRGIVVPPQNSRKLAKAIITLYSDNNMQDKFATLQYKYVMKHYSSKSVIPQLIKIYSH